MYFIQYGIRGCIEDYLLPLMLTDRVARDSASTFSSKGRFLSFIWQSPSAYCCHSIHSEQEVMPNAVPDNVDVDDSIAPSITGKPQPRQPPAAVESNDELISTRTTQPLPDESPPALDALPCETRKLIMRLVIRTGIYILYDSVPAATKESSRVSKVLLETCADEYFRLRSVKPPYWEYLLPPTISSIFWTLMHRQRNIKPVSTLALVFIPVHRFARHMLIHRLFFRFGTTNYTLLSLLGVVCCFFREDLFRNFFDLSSWPVHFSAKQGTIALLRSLLYSATFSIPLQPYIESRRRRGAAKKLLFSLVLSQISNIQRLFKAVVAAQ